MVRKKTVQRSLFLEFGEPWQRGLAIALGLTLGLLPKFGLPFASLLLITLLLPIPLFICLGVGLVVSLIAPQLAGVEQFVGTWILGSSKLQGIWETLYGTSFARAIGFHNPQVMGSLVLGLASFYPTYLATTIYFQRRRQIDLDSLFAPEAEQSQTTNQDLVTQPVVAPVLTIPVNEKIVDTVLRERSETIVPGDESLVTAHLLALPNIQPPTLSATSATDEASVEARLLETVASTPVPHASTASLVYSEEDIAEAERILHELVSAKQHKLNRQSNDGKTDTTSREIEEQQWVLDTLIEIIRLKDEAVKSHDAHSPTADTTNTSTTASAPTGMKNLLAPLAVPQEPTHTETTSNNNTNHPNRATDSSMDKLSRTDAGVASTTVNAIGSSEQVERMSSSPPSPVNVVPHTARPRSMHTRDESLRFLIHHLQCLQREREE